MAWSFRILGVIKRMSSNSPIGGPVEASIIEKLKTLAPSFLSVENESYKHNVPKGEFKSIVLVYE